MTEAGRQARDRRLQELADAEAAVKCACDGAGFVLRTSVMQSGKTSTPHWHFHAGEGVVFHWWPTNGKWRRPSDESKGVELDPWVVFGMASAAAHGWLEVESHLRSMTGAKA